MGIITAIITAILAVLVFLIAVVGNALSKLLADDAKAWLPKIVEHLVRRAVKKLPDAYQEIYYDEWRAHLDEMPGDLVKQKLAIALRFQYAAWKMRTEALSLPPISARLVVIPLLVLAIWSVYTTFRGLADFFDLPTNPNINPGQFAFGFIVTIIVLGFMIASRLIWNFKSEEASVLLLKAVSVICIAINVSASWVGTKRVIFSRRMI